MSKSEISDASWWNLWARRLRPYGELQEDDHVILVDSWPGGSRLGWEVKVSTIVHSEYDKKSEAVGIIAGELGVLESSVMTDPYTADKPDRPGVLIAWHAQPLRYLGIPRPTDFVFGRHGWLVVEDAAVLKRWGVEPARRSPRRS